MMLPNRLLRSVFIIFLLHAADVAETLAADCNSNGTDDAIDIIAGTSQDCDTNGIPDECELPILFVDAHVVGGDSTGYSWANAIPFLQDALNSTATCRITEIWVAAGAYQPDQGKFHALHDRGETFLLRNGIAIYGGFAGTESELSERDFASNLTILDGDINPDTTDCLNVVTAMTDIDSTAVLDGFTITSGRGDLFESGSASEGAGMWIWEGASPIVRNCTFCLNLAEYGGGAVSVAGPASFENCTFANNYCAGNGGAVGVYEAAVTFKNCTFVDNYAGDFGGGLFVWRAPTGLVDKCAFVGNTAEDSGGGILITSNSVYTVSNSFFGTNGAPDHISGGGGIAVFHGTSASILNCVLSNNSAGFGGGVDVFRATATIVNSTFSRNISIYPGSPGGGGLENSEGAGTSVVNCIFRENESAWFGPDQIAQVQDEGMATNLRISHSNVQGGEAGIDSCTSCGLTYTTSNIDADPLLVDPDGDDDRFGTPDDNLRLLPGSPCIDAGSNGAVASIPTDFDGNPRIHNVVDMGAFEDFADCNSNAIADSVELMDSNDDGAIDLLDFKAFQLCFGDVTSNCLAAFDRALDCGMIDLADYQVLFDQYTGPVGGMMMLMDGGGEGFGMMAGSHESSLLEFGEPETGTESPWTFEQAELDLEIQSVGGGNPLTMLEPYTAYELHYDAKADGLTSAMLGSLAASAAEGLSDVNPPASGAWSDTGSFLFEAFTDENPIPDPAGSGLYRTTWTRNEVVLTGESNAPAPASGFLYIITTGDAGTLTLELYMDYVDENTNVWVTMEKFRMYPVEE